MHADGVECSSRLHLHPASRLTHRDEKAARLTLPSAAPATSPRRARSARTRTKAHGGTKDKARACRRGWGERAASDGSPARRERSRGPASAAISGTPRHRIRILRSLDSLIPSDASSGAIPVPILHRGSHLQMRLAAPAACVPGTYVQFWVNAGPCSGWASGDSCMPGHRGASATHRQVLGRSSAFLGL